MKKGIAESFKETLPLNANFHVQMQKIYYSNFPDLVTLKPNKSYNHSYLKKSFRIFQETGHFYSFA